MANLRRAVLFGAAVLILVGMAAAHGAEAESGSLVFSKKGHVDCGDIFAVPEGTIEFWFKPTTTRNNEWPVSVLKDKDNHMVMGFGPTAFMYMVKKDGKWSYALFDKKKVVAGEWRHMACTFTAGKATMFMDGVRQASRTGMALSLEHLKGGTFVIGKGQKREYFNGLTYEVRLSDSVRYTKNFTPPTAPFGPDAHTVALWHFAGKGETVSDAGAKENHGKIVGTVERSTETPFAAAAAK